MEKKERWVTPGVGFPLFQRIHDFILPPANTDLYTIACSFGNGKYNEQENTRSGRRLKAEPGEY